MPACVGSSFTRTTTPSVGMFAVMAFRLMYSLVYLTLSPGDDGAFFIRFLRVILPGELFNIV